MMKEKIRQTLLDYLTEKYGVSNGNAAFFEKKGQEIASRWNILIPATFVLTESRGWFSAMPEYLPLLCIWQEKYGNDCFTPAALRELTALFGEKLDAFGYQPGKEALRPILLMLPRGEIVPGKSVQLGYSMMQDLKNQTTLALTESYFLSRCAFGTIRDNLLVSAAALNQMETQTSLCDICTQTALQYRGLGFATENVQTLAAYLLGQGKVPVYRCHEDNYASAAVAQNAGFVPAGKACHLVFYRK